jgi:hypothetical protein
MSQPRFHVGARLLELMKPEGGIPQTGRVVPQGSHLYGTGQAAFGDAAGFREESDTMGSVNVPADKYWAGSLFILRSQHG